MAYSRTWNSAYEAVPADADQAKDGASTIRNTKIDVRERIKLEHYYSISGTDNWHGVHSPPVVSKTSGCTLDYTNEVVICSGTFTVDLPQVSSLNSGSQYLNKRYFIKNIGTGVISVRPYSGDNIDGYTYASPLTLAGQYSSVEIVAIPGYDNVSWVVTGGTSYLRGTVTGTYTIGGTSTISVESWTNFSPATGWTAQTQCSYMKDPMGFVHLKGFVQASTGGGMTIYNALPSGYRPVQDMYFGTAANSSNDSTHFRVSTAGVIYASSYVQYNNVWMDGNVFRAEN